MNQGNMPIFLFLSVASVALFSFIAVAVWADSRRREREAFYRSEVLKKIAETQGPGAESALEFLRESEKKGAMRRREGLKLGGVINIAAGVGLTAFLSVAFHGSQVGIIGTIPLVVGLALLLYVYVLGSKA